MRESEGGKQCLSHRYSMGRSCRMKITWSSYCGWTTLDGDGFVKTE